MDETEVEVLATSDNYSIFRVAEEDGEVTYHLETGAVTIHFYREEWEELLALLKEL